MCFHVFSIALFIREHISDGGSSRELELNSLFETADASNATVEASHLVTLTLTVLSSAPRRET